MGRPEGRQGVVGRDQLRRRGRHERGVPALRPQQGVGSRVHDRARERGALARQGDPARQRGGDALVRRRAHVRRGGARGAVTGGGARSGRLGGERRADERGGRKDTGQLAAGTLRSHGRRLGPTTAQARANGAILHRTTYPDRDRA